MKVEYIDPFVQAARAVLEESLGSVETGFPGLRGNTFSTAATNIAARVSGSLSGEVVYSMSQATARKLVEQLTGTPVHSFGPAMGGSLAQLGGLLAGRTRQILIEQGHECDVGSPFVFQGLNVEFCVAEPALSVPLETDAGEIYVSVAVNDAKQS